jgi:hypothetical protein
MAHCRPFLCYNKTNIEGNAAVAFCAVKKKGNTSKAVVAFFAVVRLKQKAMTTTLSSPS